MANVESMEADLMEIATEIGMTVLVEIVVMVTVIMEEVHMIAEIIIVVMEIAEIVDIMKVPSMLGVIIRLKVRTYKN